MKLRLGVGLVCLVVTGVACTTSTRREVLPRVSTGQGAQILGTWRVVDHECPAICAMDDRESAGWIGRTAEYAAGSARMTESCASASYATKTVSGDEFFRDFKFDHRQLGIELTVTEIDVSCGGKDWIAPGAMVLVGANGGPLYTLWDGVYFKLEREP